MLQRCSNAKRPFVAALPAVSARRPVVGGVDSKQLVAFEAVRCSGRGYRNSTVGLHALAVLMRLESLASGAPFGAIQRKSPRCCTCCAAFRVPILACRAFSATFGPKCVTVRAFCAAVAGKSAKPRVLARDGPGFLRERSRFKRGGRIGPLPAGCQRRTWARNGGQGLRGRPPSPRSCTRAWSTALSALGERHCD